MAKIIHCKDVGFDCEGVIKAKTEEEALQLAALFSCSFTRMAHEVFVMRG